MHLRSQRWREQQVLRQTPDRPLANALRVQTFIDERESFIGPT